MGRRRPRASLRSVNPYARALALVLRLVALGIIALAGLSLLLEYARQRMGHGEGGSKGWLLAAAGILLGLILLLGSGRWARRWTRHWDE